MTLYVGRCELLNIEALAAVNAFFNKTYTLTPTLFLEFHAPTRTTRSRTHDAHTHTHTHHRTTHAHTKRLH